MTEMRRRMEVELSLRNFSFRTRKVYISWVSRFAAHYRKRPELMGNQEARDFLIHLLSERKLSRSSVVQAYCALKFFYVHVLHKPYELGELHFARGKRKLPVVLSEQEVRQLLMAAANLREQAILMTLYASGLRLNELLNLRVKDIDSTKKMIRVRKGKGEQERNVILSQTLLEVLLQYFRKFHPEMWLFYGETPQHRLSDRVVQKMIRRVAQKAGLRQRVTCHTLRHSFATHLFERGTELRYIQELLGHRSLRSTVLYTRISPRSLRKVTSPMDWLGWKTSELG